MKKINAIIFSALALIAAASCNKEVDVQDNPTKGKAVVLTAKLEGTKTSLDGVNIVWSRNDFITAFNIDGENILSTQTEVNEDGSEAQFTVVSGSDLMYAICPANTFATMDDNGTITTEIPTTQAAVAGSFADGANLAIANINDVNNLRFKNVGGLLAFKVKASTHNIVSATISGNVAGEVGGMTGAINVSIDNQDNVSSICSGPCSVTVDGTIEVGQTYYAVVAPGTYSNVTIVFTDDQGNTATYTKSADLVVERNSNQLIGGFSPAENRWEASEKYYVKVTSLDELESGAQYVIGAMFNDGEGYKFYAIPSSPTLDKGKINGSVVAVDENGILESNAADYTWTITSNGNLYIISDNSAQLSYSGSGTNLAYGTSTNGWAITLLTDYQYGSFRFTASNANTRGLLFNGTVFGGYALTNAGASYPGIDLYKFSGVTKSDPDLSFDEDEFSINSGDSFTAPTLNNPYNLPVTWTSSDNDIASVSQNGEVQFGTNSGTVTITASFAGNDTYKAGFASYTIVVTDPNVIDYVELDWTYPTDGAATSAGISEITGVVTQGLGSDYATSYSPYCIKFDGTGDFIQVKTDVAIGNVLVKYKKIGGEGNSSLSVLQSVNGVDWSEVGVYNFTGNQNAVGAFNTGDVFSSDSRFVKMVFTKVANVGIGGITITKADTTPRFTVESPLSATPAANEYAVSITRKNFTGAITVNVPADCNWIEADNVAANASSFNVRLNANNGENRTATLTLSAEGVASQELVVNQEGTIQYGTEDNPYTASQAIQAATALGNQTVENVYVKGIVYRATLSSGNLTYYVSDNGESSNGFEMYQGKYINGDNFTAETKLNVGDFVVAKGTLTYYKGQAELASGNEVVSVLRAPVFSIAGATYASPQTLTLGAEEGATIYYTIDGTTPTTASTVYSTAISINEDMTVKAFAVKGDNSTGVVSAAYIIDEQANDGSLEKPFTASEASALALAGNTQPYYVSGIITSIVNQYDASYGTSNFWISDNETDQTIEGFKIKYFGNTNWVVGNALLAAGDEVIIHGSLTKYNNTPEVANGYLVSLNGKTKALSVPTLSATTDDNNKKITVTWGAATGTESAISYAITCGTLNHSATTSGSYTFTMSDYGTYSISLVASADDAISATANTNATLNDPTVTTKDYYKLVTDIDDITAGTYVVGALRSESVTDNFYFGKASVSSGDWVVSDNYVTVAESNGVRRFEIANLPSGAVEFTFTGDNNNGFTIANGSNYLYYTALSSRKLAFAADGSSQKWIVVEKDKPLIAGGVCLSAVTTDGNYTISENATGTAAIRGYASTNKYRAIYLFKKVNE